MAKKYKLDNIDINILKILSSNGKISNVELSRKVGISPSPCLRRVKLLELHNIIKGYSAEVNYPVLSYNMIFFASISTKFNSQNDKESFEKELNNISQILEIYLLNNEMDYLIKIIVKDYIDYKSLVNNILTRISFIKKIRITKINKVIKRKNFEFV